MKLPADVRLLLQRRFDKCRGEWLGGGQWPLELALGTPTEQSALAQLDATRAWVAAWRAWQGGGTLQWTERRWRTLGTQRLPELLLLDSPAQVAQWLDAAESWERAAARHALLLERWPALASRLSRLFEVLSEYSPADFDRVIAALDWLDAHPDSGLYLRQLPVPGLDTKWMESRKPLLGELLCCLRGLAQPVGQDFFALCGLRRPAPMLRLRILDPSLRAKVGGMGDLAVPLDELASLQLDPARILVVENLQSGLALENLPGTVAFLALGYSVDLLARIPWVARAEKVVYWGDVDTHGFAILSRARASLPDLRSVLMDEQTLLGHRSLWTTEPGQHAAGELPGLLREELAVYRGLKTHQWGRSIRLEQERINWDVVRTVLPAALQRGTSP